MPVPTNRVESDSEYAATGIPRPKLGADRRSGSGHATRQIAFHTATRENALLGILT